MSSPRATQHVELDIRADVLYSNRTDRQIRPHDIVRDILSRHSLIAGEWNAFIRRTFHAGIGTQEDISK